MLLCHYYFVQAHAVEAECPVDASKEPIKLEPVDAQTDGVVTEQASSQISQPAVSVETAGNFAVSIEMFSDYVCELRRGAYFTQQIQLSRCVVL